MSKFLINKKGIFMKKTAIVLVVALASSTSNAFYGSQLIQKEHNQEYEKPSFLDGAHAQDEQQKA